MIERQVIFIRLSDFINCAAEWHSTEYMYVYTIGFPLNETAAGNVNNQPWIRVQIKYQIYFRFSKHSFVNAIS